MPHGFECETQGTLFFKVARIIKSRRPQAFLLENVKNLLSHDRSRTFGVIRRTLGEKLGCHLSCKVHDARRWVPQHRERIFLAGFRDAVNFSFGETAKNGLDERLAASRQNPGIPAHKRWRQPMQRRSSDATRKNPRRFVRCGEASRR